MVPITRLEAETEICDIKIQITDFLEELMSHEYEAYNRKQEGLRRTPANKSNPKPLLER